MTLSNDGLEHEVGELTPTFGSNSFLIYSMGLHLRTLDYRSLSTECLLDGPQDKKVDFFHLDYETTIATIAQGYQAQSWTKAQPPSNKAADLNTAINWLLESDLSHIPRESVRAAAEQLRDALTQGEINRLEIYFVHNLPESRNVDDELETVGRATQRLLEHFRSPEGVHPECVAMQAGRESVDRWRRTNHEAISVSDDIILNSKCRPQELHSTEWHAVVATIPAQQLVKLHEKYVIAQPPLFLQPMLLTRVG
jgi:hypothetical protein